MPKNWKNNEEYNAYMRNFRLEKKQEKILSMGGKCQRCKDTRIEYLTISKNGVFCSNCLNFLKVIKGRNTKKRINKK